VKTFYPQAALEGFGLALASKLGVRVEFTTGQPRTDGSTVYLPAITAPLDSDEFAALCGIAIHEAAHVYFRSVPQHVRYASGSSLRAACFNAVLDVADETRICHFVPNAKRLLYISNKEAEARIIANDSLNNGDPVWAILAAGILFVRLGACDLYKRSRRHPHHGAMLKAYRILKRCQNNRKMKRPHRTRPQWAKIRAAADELVQLLQQFGDGSGSPDAFGPAGSDAGAAAAGRCQPGPNDQMAGHNDGFGYLEDGDGSGGGAGSAAGSGGNGRPMDAGIYAMLRPALTGPVERLARHDDADGFSDGWASGPRVGRNIEMAMIDGRCFVRRNEEGEQLHIAVLLDASGSMAHRMPKVAAVAQAFADAVKGVAASVALATFSSRTQEEPHFHDTSRFEYGGTATDIGLAWAERALSGKSGRRVCIVITDGEPDSEARTVAACERLLAARVAVIGVAYIVPDRRIRETLPMAQIVAADDPSTLALQLGMIAQRIAS
jgi:hypothetical protein